MGKYSQEKEPQEKEVQEKDPYRNKSRDRGAHRNRGVVITLAVVWGLSVGLDRVWLALDQLVPSWDPADHLIGALNYTWMVQNADWLSADWWQGIWTLSSKYPPLLYLLTTPFIRWFGASADAAVGVNVFYTAVLIFAVYGLGRSLFSSTVGLWAAGLCLLFPQFYVLRSQYFMDYPLTAWVTAAFCLLTYWKTRPSSHPLSLQRWLLAIAFGIIFGVALLTKQTALLFLAIPLMWLGFQSLWHRRWSQLAQLILGSAIAGLMMLPWSRTNWLFQISAAFSANTRSAEIEGDPSILSIEGWTFYIAHLPRAISYPLLITASVGLLWLLLQSTRTSLPSKSLPTPHLPTPHLPTPNPPTPPPPHHSFFWLLLFIGGTYIIWSAIANKDARYIMPYLPAIAVILGVGMASWRGRWRVVPWTTVGLSIVLMMTNLFTPMGHPSPAIANVFTPGGQHPVYLGAPWPHAEIIDELIAAQPYQLINLGVLPSTPEINQHNLNYFGTRSDFQVYARRMGKSQEHIDQDLRSLSWFVSVTRPQLNHHDTKSRRRQLEIAQALRRSRDFKRLRHWDLPDGSRLDLFKRKQLPIRVIPLDADRDTIEDDSTPIHLTHLSVPNRSWGGAPIPVTYSWQGSWDVLTHGAVILTWQHDAGGAIAQLNQPERSTQWLHDHFIGFGTLRPHPIQANQSIHSPLPETTASSFRVIERTAMQAPTDVHPGIYRLKAFYLDTRNGATTPLTVPDVTLRIAAAESDEPKSNESKPKNSEPKNRAAIQFAVSTSELNDADVKNDGMSDTENKKAPDRPEFDRSEVDWVSQLRTLSAALPEGIEALDPVFDQVGRFSLYDPIQSYAKQAEVTLTHRLQINPNNLDHAYALTLAQVLQRDAEGAIATLRSVIDLDSQNPHAYAYLAFVHLYALHPHAAHEAISQAIALDSNVQEFKLLQMVASLMGGNLWQVWNEGRTVFMT